MLWLIYHVPIIYLCMIHYTKYTENVEKSDATFRENTVDSTNYFNMIVDKKFQEFKTYIIGELTESAKHIIHTEIYGIVKGYRD